MYVPQKSSASGTHMRSPPVIIVKDRDAVGGIRFLSTLGKERQQALVKRLARLAAVVKPTLSPLPLETARAATFEHFSRSRLSSETTDVLVETMFHALEFSHFLEAGCKRSDHCRKGERQ